MKKKILFFVICISLLLFVISGLRGVYSTEGPVVSKAVKPVKEIKPDNKIGIAHTEIFGVLERPQVIFDHNKHTKTLKQESKKDECNACHPLNEENNLIFGFPKKVEKKDKTSVMNAYHDECIECHKKRYKENKEKTGPVTCGDCHKKKLESVRIKYPIFEFDFLSHDKHDKKLKEAKDYCRFCHHIYNEELVYEAGKEWSCYYCHDIGRKVGPALAVETRLTAKKDLTVKTASHLKCLNCHLDYGKKGLKAGPIECTTCHTGKYKTVEELAKVPRPDCDQPEKPFLDIEKAKMKGVLFDHKAHEKNSKTCRGCHHETLNACKECHGLIGSPDGKWVNTANAYHDIFSERSCAGCHNTKKSVKDCAGCHFSIRPMDLETMGPKKESCSRCHTGKKEGIPAPQKLSIAGLDKEKVKKDVEIKILEKEYKLAKFPHLKIIEKLVKISNDSKMGTYFHAKTQTICEGCHHQSRVEAEAKKDTPPYCRNCHTISFDPVHLNRPKLIAAYHRQCINCHEKMDLKKPKQCKECHEEKAERPVYILPKPEGYDETLLK